MFKETIDSIIRLDLCPLRETKQGNDYYEPKLRELGKVEEKFSRNYNIEFNAPEVSAKVRYYRKLIDNAITTELNDFFSKTNSNTLALFYRKSILGLVQTGLKEIREIIITNNLDLDALFISRDYSGALYINENTYIYHYLVLALIRFYMEFQQHFIDYIEESKQRTIDSFFVEILQWRKSDYVNITLIPTLEITPVNEVKKDKNVNEDVVLSFIYTKLQTDSQNINALFYELKQHNAIPKEEPITEFKHLFSGVKVEKPITWIGNKSDLSYLFKQLVNEHKVLDIPKGKTIWDVVDACFVDKNGKPFGINVLRKQKDPIKTLSDIKHFAYLMS